ncbi:MAG: zinc-binding dehydrogenase [Chloroflexi bacterium]|nr:zinc-binding dehydrogenase [Chloroflexota bacterium]
MKIVYLYEHGPAVNLKYMTDAPVPEPGPNEVRVKVEAAAMNRLDIWVRNGWKGLELPMPHILGADAAGIVDAVGEGVEGWSAGDRVAVNPGIVDCGGCEWCERGLDNYCNNYHIMGETTTGTYAGYIVVPARNLLALPEYVSFAEAAAAGLVFLTAWHSLIVRGKLRTGESVLVVGASGGVNTASIQIAKLTGCAVYVVGSSDEKLEEARAIGADHLINRNALDDGNWSKSVYKMTDKRLVDVVVDNVGAPTMMMSIRSTRPGGRVLTVGNTGGPRMEIDNRHLFFRHVSIIGSTMGTSADYKDVMRLVFAGKLKGVVGAEYPLEDAVEAHRAMESGDVFGKIVLKP